MKCPACEKALKQVNVGDVGVDVCEGGCGGMWFDWFELEKFDEPHESLAEPLLPIEKNHSVTVDRSRRYNCPKCDGIVMMRSFFSVKGQVEVDECPGCGGVWLDAGELEKIRGLFDSEEERHEAAREHFAREFGDELAVIEAELAARLEKVERISNMLRFLYPSHYIPGRQDWGTY